MRPLLLVPLFVACAQPVDPLTPLEQTNGSRLKARVIDGGHGAVAFHRLVDTELEVDCLFVNMSDGRLHCVPNANGYLSGFADGNCERRAIFSYSRYEAASTVFTPDHCGETEQVARVYDLGRTLDQIWHLNEDGQCSLSHPLSVGGRYYEVLGELGPEAFVAGEWVQIGTGPLTAKAFAGDDGSFATIAMHDGTNDMGCLPGFHEGQSYCFQVTYSRDAQHIFKDADCQERIGTVSNCQQQFMSELEFEQPEPGCFSTLETVNHYRIGPSFDPASEVFRNTSGTCSPSPTQGSDEYIQLEPVSVEETFLPLQEVRVGEGRLKARLFRGAQETWSAPYLWAIEGHPFFDTNLDVACGPMFFSDAQRCIPEAPRISHRHFSDPECTKEVGVVGRNVRTKYAVITSPLGYEVRHISGWSSSETLYELEPGIGGACTTSRQRSCGNTKLAHLGDTIPTESLATLEYRTAD